MTRLNNPIGDRRIMQCRYSSKLKAQRPKNEFHHGDHRGHREKREISHRHKDTWFSFIAVVVLFGLEHHRFVVGIIIGILFNLLMIWRKKLACCVFAHAVTNLGLAIYVLTTGSWAFW